MRTREHKGQMEHRAVVELFSSFPASAKDQIDCDAFQPDFVSHHQRTALAASAAATTWSSSPSA